MTSWHIYEYFLDIIFSWKKNPWTLNTRAWQTFPGNRMGPFQRENVNQQEYLWEYMPLDNLFGAVTLWSGIGGNTHVHTVNFWVIQKSDGSIYRGPMALVILSNVFVWFQMCLISSIALLRLWGCWCFARISSRVNPYSQWMCEFLQVHFSHSNDFWGRYFAILNVEPNQNTRIPSSQR